MQTLQKKTFENKMKQEYKLKKERWKREMSQDTPKRQRDAMLSQHKETFKEIDAAETQRMSREQKEYLDREVSVVLKQVHARRYCCFSIAPFKRTLFFVPGAQVPQAASDSLP